MLRIITFFFTVVFCSHILASNLVINIKQKLPELIEKNILSHLGKLPNNELERSAFTHSTTQNITNALQALGYYQSIIKKTVNKKGEFEQRWQLTLDITLNEPTLIESLDIKIYGDAENDKSFQTLINQNTIKIGDPLNHGIYEQLKSEIIYLGLQRGYFDGILVQNNIVIEQTYQRASIKIHYQSGPRYRYGQVNFNQFDINADILEALTPFKYGDYYSYKSFHRLQNQLQSSHYFTNIIAIPEVTNAQQIGDDFYLPVNVSLQKAKSHQFDLGFGYATDTQFRFSAAWRTPLINRYGHYQETKLEYSPINPTARFIYSIPLSHPLNDVLQIKFNIENGEYADLSTKFISLQLGHVVNKNNWVSQTYLRSHHEAWDYNLAEEQPNILWSEQDSASYLIPGVTWSKTKRSGSPLDPSHGFRQTYNIEAAHMQAGSDSSFFRVNARWNYITTLKDNHRLVTRAELGAVYIDREALLAPSLRFYAGGDQSIRGFAYQSIGSTVPSSEDENTAVPIVVGSSRLAVGSIEYQYYLNHKWRLAFFTDGGSAANKGEFDFVYSLGTGLHYLSPVGAIRIDLAYGIDGDDRHLRLHFNLGAEL